MKQEDIETDDDEEDNLTSTKMKPSPVKSASIHNDDDNMYGLETDDDDDESELNKKQSALITHPDEIKHEASTPPPTKQNNPTTTINNENQQCMLTSPESISDELILHILQYLSSAASVRFGLTSKKWGEKILQLHSNYAEASPGDSNSTLLSMRLWKLYSNRRWGSGVPESPFKDVREGHNWYHYYRQRCSTQGNGEVVLSPNNTRVLTISPLDLIQEQYAHDPYRLLSACILSSRTRGGNTIRKIINDFMKKYPTPTSVIDADASTMAIELHSLGFKREVTMKRFATGFMQHWTNVKDLYGCGDFAAQSFAVFCRGDYHSVLKDKKADRNVKAYAAYLKKMQEPKGKSDDEANNLQSKTGRQPRKRKLKQTRDVVPRRKLTRNR